MAIASPFGKKEEIYGFQTLYREIGNYISRLEQYERALKFFDEAIRKTPNDRRALMGRAWARSKFTNYQGALEDLRVALNLDPDDLPLLAQKSLNYYLNCEFEEGLLQNYRMLPIRKKPENFVVGAMHCAEAIENCLGVRAGRPLRDHFLIIRNLGWKRYFEAQKSNQPKPRYKKKKPPSAKNKSGPPAIFNLTQQGAHDSDSKNEKKSAQFSNIVDVIYPQKVDDKVKPPKTNYPYRPLQKWTSNIENFMAERYLHSLYKDKLFLKNISSQPGVNCPNEKGTKRILHLSKMSYKYICYKQELLRSRRPFYFIKYQEAKSSASLKRRQDQELQRQQNMAKEEADSMKSKMQTAVDDNNLKLVLELSDKLRVFCETKPKRIFPCRDDYLLEIYDSVCQAFFDLKRLNMNQYSFEQEKRIEVMLGLEVSREPSEDSVIGQFKGVFVDWKKQISIYGERLNKASTPEETAWLYHELSRFHCELKQYDLCRVYARKCITEGKRMGDFRWVINAIMLIIKVNVLQHNKNDAKNCAIEAVEIAKSMSNDDLEEFFLKTVDVIEKIEFDSILGAKVLQKREQKIIEMMGGKMKDEAAHLFRQMQAMPATRRMSVMPGVKMEENESEERKGTKVGRMSIKPVAKADSDYALSASDKKNKRSADKGLGFMELIGYHLEDNMHL